MEHIGLLGLGVIGRAVGKNLLRAGYPLAVYNRSEDPTREFAALGAAVKSTPRAVAEESDILFTAVTDGAAMRDIVFGSDGLLDGVRRGSVLIDLSSINPYDSRDIGAALAEKGADMLDAPVSGGEEKAVAGTMAIMAGGRAEVFERVRPILDAIGGSAVLCGGPGAGSITKLMNQIIVAGNMMIASEALVFAKKCGVDPAVAYAAIRGGLAGSAVLETKVPKMLSGDFTPGGKLALQAKDARNILDAGHTAGAPLPLSSMVAEMMQWLMANGLGDEDHSNMVRFYEFLAKTDVRSRPPEQAEDA